MLLADANFCVKCGNDIKNKKHHSSSRNTFELNETRESRTIKAEFSDNMGSNMTETLAQLVTKKFEHKQLVKGITENVNDEKKDTENVIDVQGEVIEESKVQNNSSTKNTDANIEKLFREKNGKLNLLITDLKASVKNDYAMRLTYLIVLFYKSIGKEEVPKSIINGLLNYCGVNDGNYRGKFANAKAHFIVDSGKVEFRPAGLEQANVYLKQVFDKDKEGSWKLSDLKSGSATKKTTSRRKQNSSTGEDKKSSQSIKLVSDLNLYPNNKESLKEFYGEFEVKTNYEKNLLFTYYVTKILNSKECSLSHIYTCYKELGQKIPVALYQGLKDTETRRGWIETSNINSISITTKGENAITHKLKRK